jgi:hypothetical protein
MGFQFSYEHPLRKQATGRHRLAANLETVASAQSFKNDGNYQKDIWNSDLTLFLSHALRNIVGGSPLAHNPKWIIHVASERHFLWQGDWSARTR